MGNYKQFMGLSYVEASANILWDSKYIDRMLGMQETHWGFHYLQQQTHHKCGPPSYTEWESWVQNGKAGYLVMLKPYQTSCGISKHMCRKMYGHVGNKFGIVLSLVTNPL